MSFVKQNKKSLHVLSNKPRLVGASPPAFIRFTVFYSTS